jgi:hypothetical protein
VASTTHNIENAVALLPMPFSTNLIFLIRVRGISLIAEMKIIEVLNKYQWTSLWWNPELLAL